MNIEEVKKLMVPVTERLPEKEGRYVFVRSRTVNKELYQNFEVVDAYPAKNYQEMYKRTYTHWLDLSILTTKEKAIELARDSFSMGIEHVRSSYTSQHIDDFITENKNIL